MTRSFLALALAALLVAPALAGDGRCPATAHECLSYMIENLKKQGMIGIEGEWDDDYSSIEIHKFFEHMNAREAGLRLGDKLVAINGILLSDRTKLREDSVNRTPGKIVPITVVRNGEKIKLKVTLGAMNREQMAMVIGTHMMEHVTVAKADE